MRRRLIAGLLAAAFLSACAAENCRKPWGSGAVGGAIIGAAALGAAGGAIANNVHPPFEKQDSDRGAGIGIGIATGGILGALIGHYAFDKCEVTTTTTTAVTPPPPPPPPVTKKKIVLRGVNFDFNKYNIRPDAVPILEQACSILKQESSIDVVCNGYTDAIGSVPYNQKLSERRANAVRDWLVKCGIPASRLSTKGFGKSDPVASNATPEGRAQNRRTELVVVGQ